MMNNLNNFTFTTNRITKNRQLRTVLHISVPKEKKRLGTALGKNTVIEQTPTSKITNLSNYLTQTEVTLFIPCHSAAKLPYHQFII